MIQRFVSHGNRWASLGGVITVTVDADHGVVGLRAPFYRRSITLHDIASVSTDPDDGLNRGLLNWFTVGRADSPAGVRLSTGGTARVDLVTTDGATYHVVVDDMAQARSIEEALAPARSR